MLYKVTPMMVPPEAKPKKAREPGQPRKKRKSAVYDHEGHEVLITLMCLKCRSIKPLMQFGLRKMADGAIRNQPWCRGCRSGAGTPKPKPQASEPVAEAQLQGEDSTPMPQAAEPAATYEAADPAIEAEAEAEVAEAEADVAEEPAQLLGEGEDTVTQEGDAQPAEANPAQ
jgi:hypothetical protein